MGQLILIRHGQASLLEKEYDKLSALGERQSRLLGEHWARQGAAFHQVFTGPAKRHIRSTEIVGQVLAENGLPWPEMVVLPELAEYDAEIVLKKSVPILAEQHDEIRQLRAAFHAATDRPEAVRGFQKLFEAVIRKWIHGEFTCDGVEPWPAFTERVQHGLAKMTCVAGKGQRLAAFTSGGPIAIALQHALKTDLATTMQMSWMSYNSAMSEFLFSGARFSLHGFNATPHLNEPALFTHW